MRHMFGVEMQIPKGKLPGFYAQVIHKIGDAVAVFDRDQQLLIVESETERDKLLAILSKHDMVADEFGLWLVPEEMDVPLLDDYGFTSVSGRRYLYDHLAAPFAVPDQAGADKDRWAALEQLREHLIGTPLQLDGGSVCFADASQTELIEGIAKAFQVTVEWQSV
ncbi:hypothetical protein ACI7RC_00050 [Brevibacillus sp. B_LB10_24]|uniref:hypothetical protein n=1 Tax=Brevibacillus sp. B_LB10_24 TaxID=3380645 RepID=UPI0038B740AE